MFDSACEIATNELFLALPEPSRRPDAGRPTAARIWAASSAWVERNRGLIIKLFARVRALGPYDAEDWVQEAHVVVFEAWKRWAKDGEPDGFTGYVVWKLRHRWESSFGMGARGPCSFSGSDAELEQLVAAVTGEIQAETSEDDLDELVDQALDWMTPRQRHIWFLWLGRDGGSKRADAREIARHLGVTRRAVCEILARGRRQAAARGHELGVATTPDPTKVVMTEKALERMTPRQREAWTLKLCTARAGRCTENAGLAEKLGISPRALQKLLARGREYAAGLSPSFL